MASNRYFAAAGVSASASGGGPSGATTALTGLPSGTDATSARTNRIRIRAALKAIYDAGGSGTVFLPPGTYAVDRPIAIPGKNTFLSGDPNASTTLTPVGTFGAKGVHDLVCMGVRTDSLDSDCIISVGTSGPFGAAGNGRIAFRTKGKYRAIGMAGAFSAARFNYGSNRAVTIDLAADFTNAASFATFADILGFWIGGWNLRFHKEGASPSLSLQARQTNGTTTESIEKGWPISITGTHRYTIQYDPVLGTLRFAQDDIEIASSGSTGTIRAGWGLVAAAHELFAINGRGSEFTTGVGTPIPDFTIHGLKIWCPLLRYTFNGVGNAITRNNITGGDTWDMTSPSQRYWSITGTTTDVQSWLPLDDDPADVRADRHLKTGTSTGNGAYGFLYIWDGAMSSTADTGIGFAIKYLKLTGNLNVGQGIALGNATGCNISNVTCSGGAVGLGTLTFASTYDFTATNCTFRGNECWVHHNNVYEAVMGDLTGSGGSSGIILDNCDIKIGDILVSAPVTSAYIINATGRGALVVGDITIDDEGGPEQSKAVIQFGGTPQGKLVIGRMNCGQGGLGAPIIVLSGTDTSFGGVVEIADLNHADYDHSAIVQVASTGYSGEIPIGPWLDHRRPRILQDLTGGKANLTFNLKRADVFPPIEGVWNAGKQRITVSSPADGGPAEWRCVVSGAHGHATAGPPRWAGHYFACSNPSRLCASLGASSRWDYSGQTEVEDTLGGWSDYTGNLVLNWLFRGVSAVVPAALYLALNNRRYRPNTAVWEILAGKGHTRQSVAATLGGTGGASFGATAFGPATAAWEQNNWPNQGIWAATLFDAASSGNFLGGLDLIKFQVATGGSKSFADGSIAVAHSGAFASGILNTILAWLLNATPPGTPTPYLALSTSRVDPTALPTGMPAEPGGSYARVSAAGSSLWTAPSRRRIQNTGTLDFGATTGTFRSVWVMSNGTTGSGTPLAAGNLAQVVDVEAGDPNPAFAAGALDLWWS